MHLFCVEALLPAVSFDTERPSRSPFVPDAQEKRHPKIRLSAHLSIVFATKSGIVGALV